MSLYEKDTIAAVSTPYGKGGVALIRISGDDAISLAEKIFRAKSGKSLASSPSRYAIYGEIYNNEGRVDDVVLTLFRAPASYTGEDTVEICCHGGLLITEEVLSVVLSAGARAAEAGEYTRRAFVNGKISLSSAEALGNMLDAMNREQLKLSRSGMRGTLSRETAVIYDTLGDVLSSVFACIDYPDEDLAEMSPEQMAASLEKALSEVRRLLATWKTGHAILEGLPTVICGKTNVGKSSLYNLLLGRDAAIVTDIEGTTRDVLTEATTLGRVTLRLSDTAGLRESDDKVEMIGVERARAELESAELILAVFDSQRAADAEDIALIESLKERTGEVVAILNKCDRESGDKAIAFDKKLLTSAFGESRVLEISAREGVGRAALASCVEQMFIDGAIDTSSDAVVSNARQHAALESAESSICTALESIAAGLPLDLCCVDIEAAMQGVAEVDGRAVSEDVVAKIFSRFCVGK